MLGGAAPIIYFWLGIKTKLQNKLFYRVRFKQKTLTAVNGSQPVISDYEKKYFIDWTKG